MYIQTDFFIFEYISVLIITVPRYSSTSAHENIAGYPENILTFLI